jgi:hypothetical protein
LRAQSGDLALGDGWEDQRAAQVPMRAQDALAIQHQQPGF